MKRKAQINHIFMFIIALFIIGAIALIGVKSIGGIMNDKCNTDTVIFKNDLTKLISTNNDYGSVNYERIPIPCKYATLCLIDTSIIENGKQLSTDNFPGSFIIKQSIADGVKANAFLIDTEGNVKEVGYIKQISLTTPENATCINAKSGAFNLLLKGKGRLTEVSEKKNG